MPEGGEARIKVLLDVEEAKRGLRELNVEGERLAQSVGGAAGGGGTGGGGSGAGGVRGAAGGAGRARGGAGGGARRGGGGGGGAAGVGAQLARGMGIKGFASAPLAAAAAAAVAMTPVPGGVAGFAAGALGPHTAESFAAGKAIATPIGGGLNRFWFGDRRGMADAAMTAQEQAMNAFGMAVGAEGDVSGAVNFFRQIQQLRERENIGKARVKDATDPFVMEAGIDQVFGRGTTKQWTVELMEVMKDIRNFLKSIGF